MGSEPISIFEITKFHLVQRPVELPVLEVAEALAAVLLAVEALVAEALVAPVLAPVVTAAVLQELLVEVGVALFS